MTRPNPIQLLHVLLAKHQGVLFLLAIAVLSRALPHPDNVTPLAALGLFAGAYLTPRVFLLVPVLAALLTDVFALGTYPLLLMLFVYIGLLLSSITGRLLLLGHRKSVRLPVAVLFSALAFFLLSNLGDWLVFSTGTDLVTWYINALPFFGRSLLGDAGYALAFFGVYEGLVALQAHQQRRSASAPSAGMPG